MSRALRIEYCGAFYHVINRGNAGETIFRSHRDREKFLEYMALAVERFGLRVHAYCLMSNHYHLLVETPQPNLSRAMQWLNVSYATYFNIKGGRKGHLFQGRFKSLLVDADSYLSEVSRYIHLNPVRAKLVAKATDHLWSSYAALIGRRKAPEWLETDWLLSQFGRLRPEACEGYRQFVESVDPLTLENPCERRIGGVILGGAEFVAWVKATFLACRPHHKEVPQLKALKPSTSVRDVVDAVTMAFSSTAAEILQKGSKRNLGRDVAIYLARDLTNESGVALGEVFGGISGAGIAVRYRYVAQRIEWDQQLKMLITQIKQKTVNV
jgi:putative transposase